MEDGIREIEHFSGDEFAEMDLSKVIDTYTKYYPNDKYWKIAEHLQKQAAIYVNIIEQVKSGAAPSDIRSRFEQLDLVPENILPNPDGSRLLEFAFRKISKMRKALVDFVINHGKAFALEIKGNVEMSVGLGVEIGLPPSISINFDVS